MLVCHACNTRFDEGEAACPSCGRRASEHAADVDAVTASIEQLVRSASPWTADFKFGTATAAMDAEDLNEEDMG